MPLTFMQSLPKSVCKLAQTAVLLWSLSGLTSCVTAPSAPDPMVEAMTRDRAVQLQIFLDGRHFGPGVVDGRRGEFTSKALALFRQANGLPDNVLPDVSYIEPYTSYTVTQQDLESLGEMAVEPVDQAQQKRLPYVRLTEMLAERFHTTEAFLRELNPGSPVSVWMPGTVLKVPAVKRPFYWDQYPSAYPAPSSAAAKNWEVRVDTQYRMLEVRDGERLIAAFPITPGSAEHPAPLGEWKVVRAVPWPWYRYDEGVLKRGERTETFYNLPPGPNSPVGILWAGLNKPGVGIHGTATPETIGRSGSHGCIRLANWDAAIFYAMVQKGTKVTIR